MRHILLLITILFGITLKSQTLGFGVTEYTYSERYNDDIVVYYYNTDKYIPSQGKEAPVIEYYIEYRGECVVVMTSSYYVSTRDFREDLLNRNYVQVERNKFTKVDRYGEVLRSTIGSVQIVFFPEFVEKTRDIVKGISDGRY